jgi:hypothetical protein
MVKLLSIRDGQQEEHHDEVVAPGSGEFPPLGGVADTPDGGLSDEQLREAGLVPIQAWMKTDESRQSRKARNSRYREKQAASGVVQVSLRVPSDLVAQFKVLATESLETHQVMTAECRHWQLAAEDATARFRELQESQAQDQKRYEAEIAGLQMQLAQLKDLSRDITEIEGLPWWRRWLARVALLGWHVSPETSQETRF